MDSLIAFRDTTTHCHNKKDEITWKLKADIALLSPLFQSKDSLTLFSCELVVGCLGDLLYLHLVCKVLFIFIYLVVIEIIKYYSSNDLLGPVQDKTENAEGHLLMSGSRDQTVRLWDTVQGKVLSIKQLPKKSAQKWKDKHEPHWAKDRLWLSVCWPVASAGHVITSSQGYGDYGAVIHIITCSNSKSINVLQLFGNMQS